MSSVSAQILVFWRSRFVDPLTARLFTNWFEIFTYFGPSPIRDFRFGPGFRTWNWGSGPSADPWGTLRLCSPLNRVQMFSIFSVLVNRNRWLIFGPLNHFMKFLKCQNGQIGTLEKIKETMTVKLFQMFPLFWNLYLMFLNVRYSCSLNELSFRQKIF